jgi:hypothetical protein
MSIGPVYSLYIIYVYFVNYNYTGIIVNQNPLDEQDTAHFNVPQRYRNVPHPGLMCHLNPVTTYMLYIIDLVQQIYCTGIRDS